MTRSTYVTPISNSRPISTITSDTLLDSTFKTILVDASGGNVTLTLPLAAAFYNPSTKESISYNIKQIDLSINTVFITPQPLELIDLSPATSLGSMGIIHIQSDGTNWWLI